MYIYPSTKPAPYVYKCIHRITKQFYIGYRYKNVKYNIPSHIDLPLYRTSSKHIKLNFHEYDWVILAEFFDTDSAYEYEQTLIKETIHDPLSLNGSYFGNIRADNTGKVVVKDTNGNIFQVDVTDQRYISGELMFYAIGKKHSNEYKIKQSIVQSGKVTMFDPVINKNIRVAVNDSRIKSGELIPFNLGKHHQTESKKKISNALKGRKKEPTVCRLDTKTEMTMSNYVKWINGSYNNAGPKNRVCRLEDKKEMSVNHFTRWLKRKEMATHF